MHSKNFLLLFQLFQQSYQMTDKDLENVKDILNGTSSLDSAEAAKLLQEANVQVAAVIFTTLFLLVPLIIYLYMMLTGEYIIPKEDEKHFEVILASVGLLLYVVCHIFDLPSSSSILSIFFSSLSLGVMLNGIGCIVLSSFLNLRHFLSFEEKRYCISKNRVIVSQTILGLTILIFQNYLKEKYSCIFAIFFLANIFSGFAETMRNVISY